jgi:hypothetical protein
MKATTSFQSAPNRADVAGLATYASLADVPGAVDLVVVFRTPPAVPAHVEEAAAKGAEAVWLPPGAWSQAADVAAKRHGLTPIKECCVMDEHRQLSQRSGHPGKWGVHVRRRKPVYEDNRKRPDDGGYRPNGGGGHVAGGGGRSVLDEKKMVTGTPSRRRDQSSRSRVDQLIARGQSELVGLVAREQKLERELRR